MMSAFLGADRNDVASVLTRFLHRQEIRSNRSSKRIGLLRTNRTFGQIVGPPSDFHKDQFVAIEGNEINFSATDLVIPSDNGIAKIHKVFGGLRLGSSSLRNF